MKKKSSAPAAPANEGTKPAAKPGKTVTVKVKNPGGLGEAEGRFACGDTFETTPDRAKSLGDLVEIL